MNLLPDGFFSEAVDHWIVDARASAPKWFSLVTDVNRDAVRVLTTLVPRRSCDRELIAAALFARAVQSFEASVILSERGMLSDAGAIARSVVESAIFLGGVAHVQDFSRNMAGDNNAHYYSMAKAIAEQLEQWGDDSGSEDAAALRTLVSEVDEKGHKRKSINLRQIAKDVGMDFLYEFVYRRLSGEHGHPTLTSLEWHFSRGEFGLVDSLTFKPQRAGLETVLTSTICALLAAMEAVSDVFERPDIREAVRALNARHHALSPNVDPS